MKQIIFGPGVHQSICDWVASKAGGRWLPGEGVANGLVEDGKLIAGVVYDNWNGASLQIHVAAEPGCRWMTRDYLWEVFAYPFEVVKCKKLVGLVGSGNLAARRFDEHLGFVCEATLHDAHPTGDLLVYTMTAAQCRWIGDRRPRGKKPRPA